MSFVPTPTGEDVAEFLAQGGNLGVVALAQDHTKGGDHD